MCYEKMMKFSER